VDADFDDPTDYSFSSLVIPKRTGLNVESAVSSGDKCVKYEAKSVDVRAKGRTVT
jgi:hypothetical protein